MSSLYGGRGWKVGEIWWNDLRMAYKNIFRVVFILVALQIIVFGSLALRFVDRDEVSFLGRYYFTKAIISVLPLQASKKEIITIRWFDGKDYRTTIGWLVESPEALKVVDAVTSKIIKWFEISALVYFLFPLIMWVWGRRASNMQAQDHIRGTMLIDYRSLKRQLRREKKNGVLPIGPIVLPTTYEPEHIAVVGKTRQGKTVLMEQQILEIRKNGFKGIIYDFKGDFVGKFFDPAKDVLFNPLDPRGIKWNLFSELKNVTDVTAVAQSLIPPARKIDDFFNDAARDVFVGVLNHLYQQGKTDNKSIFEMTTSSVKNIAEALKTTTGGERGWSYIEDHSGKQALSVKSVMVQYCGFFEHMQEGIDDFSLSGWLTDEKQGFLFLTNYSEIADILRPGLSLFVDLLGRRLLGLEDTQSRRIYFVLDEFATLQNLPTIKRLLTAGGSKGACVIMGLQDFAQLEQIYGREGATSMFNSFGTLVGFNLADPDTAKFLSGRFGDREYWETSEHVSMGVGNNRDGRSLTRQRRIDPAVLPSEIQGLRKLEAYLKMPEYNPTKIQLSIGEANNLKPTHKPFILREGLSLDEIRVKHEETAKTAKEIILQLPAEKTVQAKPRQQKQGEIDITDELNNM